LPKPKALLAIIELDGMECGDSVGGLGLMVLCWHVEGLGLVCVSLGGDGCDGHRHYLKIIYEIDLSDVNLVNPNSNRARNKYWLRGISVRVL
jgi:hypothetical protein